MCPKIMFYYHQKKTSVIIASAGLYALNKYMSSDVRLNNLKLKMKTVNIKNFY